MIHPKWTEFAKIAFRQYLSEDADDDQSFEDWSGGVVSDSATLADMMCVEYDKRNNPDSSDAPQVSKESVDRLAALKPQP